MPDSFLAYFSPDRGRMGSVDVWPMARLLPLEFREIPTQRLPSSLRAEVSSWDLQTPPPVASAAVVCGGPVFWGM